VGVTGHFLVDGRTVWSCAGCKLWRFPFRNQEGGGKIGGGGGALIVSHLVEGGGKHRRDADIFLPSRKPRRVHEKNCILGLRRAERSTVRKSRGEKGGRRGAQTP